MIEREGPTECDSYTHVGLFICFLPNNTRRRSGGEFCVTAATLAAATHGRAGPWQRLLVSKPLVISAVGRRTDTDIVFRSPPAAGAASYPTSRNGEVPVNK